MAERDLEPLKLGGLWRDVVNFLGSAPLEPTIYLPLLQHVLPRWQGWTGFLNSAAVLFERDRAEVEADVARAELGWDIWIHRRDRLRRVAEKAAARPINDDELAEWWLRDDHPDWSSKLRGIEASARFAAAVRITGEEEHIIEPESRIQARRRQRKHDWLIVWINKDLAWLDDLEVLRALAQKTWTADTGERVAWTRDDLRFVNRYYEEMLPSLYVPGDPDVINPLELDTETWDQGFGWPMDGLRACFLVLMRAAIVDFADEILERNRRPTSRGSLRCVECGLFAGRRALGYGQLYCSDRCKKRAAKRRYRGRSRIDSTASGSASDQ